MLIKDFKILVKDLDPNTKVTSSVFSKTTLLEKTEMPIITFGYWISPEKDYIDFRYEPGLNHKDLITIKLLIELHDNCFLSIQNEDDLGSQDVLDVLFYNNYLILLDRNLLK